MTYRIEILVNGTCRLFRRQPPPGWFRRRPPDHLIGTYSNEKDAEEAMQQDVRLHSGREVKSCRYFDELGRRECDF